MCLRTPSTGIVEVDEAKGLVKYAKPAGVIASLIPMTNPAMTPPVTGVSSANARNAVIFSPHPRTAQTTFEMVEVMRAACRAVARPKTCFRRAPPVDPAHAIPDAELRPDAGHRRQADGAGRL